MKYSTSLDTKWKILKCSESVNYYYYLNQTGEVFSDRYINRSFLNANFISLVLSINFPGYLYLAFNTAGTQNHLMLLLPSVPLLILSCLLSASHAPLSRG